MSCFWRNEICHRSSATTSKIQSCCGWPKVNGSYTTSHTLNAAGEAEERVLAGRPVLAYTPWQPILQPPEINPKPCGVVATSYALSCGDQIQWPMMNMQAKRRSEFLKGDQDLLDGLFGGSSETVPSPPRANIWAFKISFICTTTRVPVQIKDLKKAISSRARRVAR